ncbi:MAG: RCC1 domain-containing protein, partial [Acidimicrobiaceae bacterium]|nr:RCC1 domain-containing protein [Acidimicrobiaceae bacterium]
MSAGEGCRYSGGGRHRAEVVLSVSRDGLICREGGPAQHQDLQFDNLRICRDDAFVRDDTFESSILVERGRDGSWAFYSSAAALQTAQASDPVDLREDSAPCTAGLLLHPGDECSTGGFTMSIREDGAAVLDGNIGGISMGNTVMNAQSINLNRFNATRSGSTWTIERLPGISNTGSASSPAAALQTAKPSDPVDLGGGSEPSVPCTAGLLLHPGDECSTGGFTMSIREDGAAVLDGNIGGISMGNTVMNAQSINLNRFNATRSGSTWTIERLPGISNTGSASSPAAAATPSTSERSGLTSAPSTSTPATVRSIDTFKAVTAGGVHSCGLRTNDTITCWGDNEFGQANAPADTFKAVTAGRFHSCGLRTDDTVTCWGWNDDGQADAPAGNFKAVTAGWSHSCGLRTDDTVTCWGDNDDGRTDAPAGN